MSSSEEEYIAPGDIVAVHYGQKRQEGLVTDSYYNRWTGQQVLVVRLDSDEIYRAHYPWPSLTRVKRTTYVRPSPVKQRTIERHVYW